MQDHLTQIESLGASVAGVSVAADFQARWLTETQGITYPLLLDPDSNLRDALGFKKMSWWRYLLPQTYWLYLKGWRRSRQGKITGNPTLVPGIVIFDADGALRYRHEGVTLGDYPPISEVIAALEEITSQPC